MAIFDSNNSDGNPTPTRRSSPEPDNSRLSMSLIEQGLTILSSSDNDGDKYHSPTDGKGVNLLGNYTPDRQDLHCQGTPRPGNSRSSSLSDDNVFITYEPIATSSPKQKNKVRNVILGSVIYFMYMY